MSKQTLNTKTGAARGAAEKGLPSTEGQAHAEAHTRPAKRVLLLLVVPLKLL